MAKQLPIARMAVEAVLIVLSILVAFGIDAWWERTQEAGDLEVALATVSVGLEDSRAQLSAHRDEIARALSRLDRFVELSNSGVGDVPGDSAGLFIESIHRPYTADNNLTFLSQALDDEIAERVNDPVFSAALSQWRQTLNQLAEIDQILSVHWLEALEVLGGLDQAGPMIAWQSFDLTSEDVVTLSRNPTVKGLATRRAYFMNLQRLFLRDLDEATSELLEAVEGIKRD